MYGRSRKTLGRKDVYVAVRALLEKEIIGIKESVDDLFKPKIERLVRWKQKFASEELDGILDSLKRARLNTRCCVIGCIIATSIG